jgi:hypothetical protein
MATLHVEASQEINASPQTAYNILSDYRVGHKAILPRPYFKGMDVLEGGKGTGTRVNVYLSSFGKTRTMALVVSEPEPGHVLMEREVGTDLVTTFTVDPADDGAKSRVTIVTDFSARSGIVGMFERVLNPSLMRYVYNLELRKLNEYAQAQAEGGSRAFG